jgi:hypothetical protein
MARVTTKTAVANLTLSLMKVDAVTSIEPADRGSKAAKAMSRWYDDTRREVLSEHDWTCSIARVQLGQHPDAPAFGWGAKYLLPADYIRLAWIGEESSPLTAESYKIERGYILCDESGSLNVAYVFDNEDIISWSPKLLMTIARCLAKHTAYEITGNRTFADEMETAYKDYLSDAKGIDSQSSPARKTRRSDWASARMQENDRRRWW